MYKSGDPCSERPFRICQRIPTHIGTQKKSKTNKHKAKNNFGAKAFRFPLEMLHDKGAIPLLLAVGQGRLAAIRPLVVAQADVNIGDH